jgi:cytochrome c oxidase subunit II
MAGLLRMLRKGLTGRRLALLGVALLCVCVVAGTAWAEMPHDWQLGMEPPATPVKVRLEAFHDELLVIIFLITAFVLALLLYVIVRFNHTRNPVPSHTSHNTVIEILWTVVPVLILIFIAIPSFRLMYYMARIPKSAMTIKVTGHQWYWSYAYPDQGKLAFDSNVVQDKDLKPGEPRLLTADNPLVVPVEEVVKVEVTSTDVIHSWFVPPFGVQEYAMPGHVNEAWFKVLRPGTYYGQCNQICGINHAFMPIEIKALTKADFEKWLGDAKKKFAHDEDDGAAIRVAATAGALAGTRPASGGN